MIILVKIIIVLPVICSVWMGTACRGGWLGAGLLPKPMKLPRLWGKKTQDTGLDNAKRFLHVTKDALVLEVEGEEEVRALAYHSTPSGKSPWCCVESLSPLS